VHSTLAVDARKLIRRMAEPLAYAFDAPLVKPSNVSLSLTNRCNLKCPTCSYWHTPASAKDTELTLEEMKKLLGQLREWLGPSQVGLTGGEPFLRPEIFDLFDECSRLGLRVLIVNNGSLLPPRRMEQLLEIARRPGEPFDMISFSLNHLDPEKHDRTRGVSGSAEKIFRSLDAINIPDRAFRLTLSAIIMGYNIDNLPAMVRWAQKRGLDGVTLQIYYFQSGNENYVPGWFEKDPFWDSDRAKIDRHVDELLELKAAGAPLTNTPEHLEYIRQYLKDPEKPITIPCKVGVANLDIDPNGDVRLCDVMKPIGNVRDTHPQEIWASAMARERRKEIHGCEAACRIKTCNFRKPLGRVLLERLQGK